MTASAAISVETVSKRFRRYMHRNDSLKQVVISRSRGVHEDFWALRDVTFKIAKGEMFGLIGHNGSGKSTLLKLIAGILVPDRGGVRTAGRTSSLLELGAGFHPELSGRENVFLNGTFFGYSRREIASKMGEVIEFSGLAEVIDEPVKTYSSGMYARLGFSVATSVDPDILLVDEVLAVGDVEFQQRCIERITDFRRQGRTIVFVSHAAGVVRQLCDRVAWFDHGHLRDVGDANALLEQYLEESYEVAATEQSRCGAAGQSLWNLRVCLKSAGGASEHLRTGDSFELLFRWDSPTVVDKAGIAFSIDRHDGLTLFATSTVLAEMRLDIGVGPSELVYSVPAFDALPGNYSVSIAICDQHGRRVAERRHAMHFAVVSGADKGASGVFTPRGTWRIQGSGT